jgi:hypothetical protein
MANQPGYKSSWNTTYADNNGVLFTDRRNLYLDPNITHELYPSVTPFLTFISRVQKRKKTKDPDFKMFEHRSKFYDMYCLINDGAISENLVVGTETGTIAIDGMIGGIQLGSLVDVWNNAKTTYKGQAIVTTYTSQTSIELTATYVSSAALADNDYLFIISDAQAEGSGAPTAFADELEIAWNSCGIMKTPVQITGTLLEMSLKGYSKELARLRIEKEKEHKMKKEKAFLFSRRIGGLSTAPAHTVDSSGNAIRTTHGIIPSIEGYNSGSNVIQRQMATFNYDAFVDDMVTMFADVNERSVKYGFAGAGYLSYLNKISQGGFLRDTNIYLNPNTKMSKYGFNIRELETPEGVLKLVPTRELTKTHGGLYTNTCVIIDPENVYHVTYRPSKYQTSIQDNDVDGIKDQYFSDEGCGVVLPETHFIHKLV